MSNFILYKSNPKSKIGGFFNRIIFKNSSFIKKRYLIFLIKTKPGFSKIKRTMSDILLKILQRTRKPKYWFLEKIKSFDNISRILLTTACWALTYNRVQPFMSTITKLILGLRCPYKDGYPRLGSDLSNYPYIMYTKV